MQARAALSIDVHGAGAAGAMPQPNLVPVRPSSSRSTQSSGVSGSLLTSKSLPFTRRRVVTDGGDGKVSASWGSGEFATECAWIEG